MELIKDSVDYIIFAILGLMGFVTVWLTIERLLFLRSVQPSGYADKDSYDKALTDNLTTLYIIYSNAPLRRAFGDRDRHHDHLLRHGAERQHQRFRHHDGVVSCA